MIKCNCDYCQYLRGELTKPKTMEELTKESSEAIRKTLEKLNESQNPKPDIRRDK